MKDLKERCDTFSSVLSQFSGTVKHSPSPGPIMENSNAAMTTALNMASSCDKFTKNTAADEFWFYFEDVCMTNNISIKIALILLSNLVAKHPTGPMWFSTYVSPIEHINLTSVKLAFSSQFLPEEAQTDRFQELLEIRYRSSETVRVFSNRFIEKMRLNEIALNSEDAAHSYVKKVNFFKLPASVRRFTGSVDLKSFKNTQELIEKMCKFPGIPEVVKKFSQRCYLRNQLWKCTLCINSRSVEEKKLILRVDLLELQIDSQT